MQPAYYEDLKEIQNKYWAMLDDGSRVLVRLSGTGTQGATLRVYFESFVPSDGDITQDPQLALDPLIKSIDSLAEISKRTGMSAPTVIT